MIGVLARRVMLIGLGTIGSHLAPLLVRLGVAELVLVDGDRYSTSNLGAQSIRREHVGRPKVEALAEEARAIDERVTVVPYFSWLEDVPWGGFDVDLIVTALDSAVGRVRVSEIAARLGGNWIDIGVHADTSCVRVTRFTPDPDHACYECGLDDADYAALATRYRCNAQTTPGSVTDTDSASTPHGVGPAAGAAVTDTDTLATGAPAQLRSPAAAASAVTDTDTVATGAPPQLGALAAALAAGECAKLLAGDATALAPGAELVFETMHHQLHRSRRVRVPCRFDHEPWRWADTTLATDAPIATLRSAFAEHPVRSVRVPHDSFATLVACARCGYVKPCTVLNRRATTAASSAASSDAPWAPRCPECAHRSAESSTAANTPTAEWTFIPRGDAETPDSITVDDALPVLATSSATSTATSSAAPGAAPLLPTNHGVVDQLDLHSISADLTFADVGLRADDVVLCDDGDGRTVALRLTHPSPKGPSR